jgi:hypothetical protein
VTVRDVEIRDSTYAGILMTWQRRIENATFSHTAVSGAPSGGLSVSPGFTVNRGPGNSGF